jgi:hypothetical protein
MISRGAAVSFCLLLGGGQEFGLTTSWLDNIFLDESDSK